MNPVLIKVYAAFYPVEKSCFEAVRSAGAGALGHDDDAWAMLEGDMLRIAFEGIYFPLDEVLTALRACLSAQAQGKLDYLDLEAWALTRHLWQEGAFHPATRSLNHVLDHAGH